MRIVLWAAVTGLLLAVTGCADRFRPAAPDRASVVPAVLSARDRLVVSPLPSDLGWLAEGLKLYRLTGHIGDASDDAVPPLASDRMSVLPSISTAPAASSPTDSSANAAPAAADLRFVSLPLTGDTAHELAAVPAELEAATAPTILPVALQAARFGSRTIALPLAARWLALAYDPAHVDENASPVPPHLEAWVEQLRMLHRRRPEHSPLIAAWDESNIGGSFTLLLAAGGGRLLDESGRPVFSTAEGIATVELMSRMLAEGLVQPTAMSTDAHRLAASLAGPYAYWLCSSEALQDRDGPRPDRLAALRLSGLPIAASRYHYPEAASVALAQFRGVAVAAESSHAAAAWGLARFLADPVVLRSAPPTTTILAAAPPDPSAFVRQTRALMARESLVPWPDLPSMNEVLGRFLHAALRRTLTPREALERAALQISRPGALPASSDDRPGARGVARSERPSDQEAGAVGPSSGGPGSDGQTETSSRSTDSPSSVPSSAARP